MYTSFSLSYTQKRYTSFHRHSSSKIDLFGRRSGLHVLTKVRTGSELLVRLLTVFSYPERPFKLPHYSKLTIDFSKPYQKCNIFKNIFSAVVLRIFLYVYFKLTTQKS